MAFNARSAAHRALVAVERRGLGSQDALAEVLAKAPVDADPRDRALATELVYGVLRWRRRLDHALAALATKGLPVDDPFLLDALRIGAYQLLFLPRIPDFAAVDGVVRLVKRKRAVGTVRFVNGLLRNLARRREDPPVLPEGSSPAVLGVRHSQPAWILRRLTGALSGEALERRLVAENEPAPLTLRSNTTRLSATELAARLAEEGAEASPLTDLPGALRVQQPGAMFRGASLAGGLWLPQDAASQRVVALLDPQPGERVLDCCAGSGVKTTAIAERVGAEGHVRATDLSPRRIGELRDLCVRWGVDGRVSAAVDDATDAAALSDGAPAEGYDRILLDAPCTALGLLRRRPEIRWRRSEADITERAALQARLLETAAGLLRPGGRLVYAVCTFTEEEGPALLRRFLAENPAWRLVRPDEDNPAAAHLDAEGFTRTSPDRGGDDAFFAAALERPSGLS